MKLTVASLLVLPAIPFVLTVRSAPQAPKAQATPGRHVTAAAGSMASAADDSVRIDEWTVPWEKSRPRDPYVAPDGQVWFVGQVGNYIARLDPASGKFTRFEVDPGTHPHNLVVAKDGMVWYTGNRNGMLGRLDPATGKITRYAMPDSAVRDPHTMIFDAKGNAYFTAQGANYVGRLDTRTGKVNLVQIATPRARPYGIVVDPKGTPWFVQFGTNVVASLDPASLKVKEYRIPDAAARPRRIAATPDGMIWWGDFTRGMLGRLNPTTGEMKEWPLPSGKQSFPYAMTSDDQGRVWVVETGVRPNRLVGFDPATGKVVANQPIEPSGAGVVRHMMYDAKTGTIWFGTDENTIGRAKVRPERVAIGR